MIYQLNNEHTLNDLYGDLLIEWHEDLLVLRSIREAGQSKMLINISARYQLREEVPPKKKVSFTQEFEKNEQKIETEAEKIIKKGKIVLEKRITQNVGPTSDVITKRNDKLKVIIPDYDTNVTPTDIRKQKFLKTVNNIELPQNSAVIKPKPRDKLTTFANTSIYRNDMEKVSNDVITPILAEIDPERLTTKRANKKNQSIYTLQEIQDYARRLGIPVSNKPKIVLIGNIKKMIEDYTNSGSESM